MEFQSAPGVPATPSKEKKGPSPRPSDSAIGRANEMLARKGSGIRIRAGTKGGFDLLQIRGAASGAPRVIRRYRPASPKEARRLLTNVLEVRGMLFDRKK